MKIEKEMSRLAKKKRKGGKGNGEKESELIKTGPYVLTKALQIIYTYVLSWFLEKFFGKK